MSQPVPDPIPGRRSTIICMGHARLPQSVAPIGGSQVVCVELEVDRERGTITSAGVAGVPPLAEHLLLDVLPGKDVSDGAEALAQEIQARYAGVIQRALIAAVANACEVYASYVRGREQ